MSMSGGSRRSCGGGQPQRNQRLRIEAAGEADDRLDAPEVLLEHEDLPGTVSRPGRRGGRLLQVVREVDAAKEGFAELDDCPLLHADAIGDTCLSSPRSAASCRAGLSGSAVMSDWLASSMMTRSKAAELRWAAALPPAIRAKSTRHLAAASEEASRMARSAVRPLALTARSAACHGEPRQRRCNPFGDRLLQPNKGAEPDDFGQEFALLLFQRRPARPQRCQRSAVRQAANITARAPIPRIPATPRASRKSTPFGRIAGEGRRPTSSRPKPLRGPQWHRAVRGVRADLSAAPPRPRSDASFQTEPGEAFRGCPAPGRSLGRPRERATPAACSDLLQPAADRVRVGMPLLLQRRGECFVRDRDLAMKHYLPRCDAVQKRTVS